jgi:hypothetical protein
MMIDNGRFSPTPNQPKRIFVGNGRSAFSRVENGILVVERAQGNGRFAPNRLSNN